MTDLVPFTHLPTCIKCGGGMFDWHWYLPSSLAHDEHNRLREFPPIHTAEHLRLTCENCGWVLDMQPKDAR